MIFKFRVTYKTALILIFLFLNFISYSQLEIGIGTGIPTGEFINDGYAEQGISANINYSISGKFMFASIGYQSGLFLFDNDRLTNELEIDFPSSEIFVFTKPHYYDNIGIGLGFSQKFLNANFEIKEIITFGYQMAKISEQNIDVYYYYQHLELQQSKSTSYNVFGSVGISICSNVSKRAYIFCNASYLYSNQTFNCEIYAKNLTTGYFITDNNKFNQVFSFVNLSCGLGIRFGKLE